ncbi:hypothetical protein QYE76_045270 [Lolium multiflorum]|uniref:CCHC-type domain-containing protein n=1 Tax=Lolium multiflorum TaxID=4521 RepID=A0AAD8WXC0_LOLMU|nr:hypothetical protein QYE76_045270 [Lolium multiflorum]
MLKSAEIEIKKEHQVLMVNKTTSFKKHGKSKGKFKKGGKKAATPPVKPKNGPKPDAECYYCKEKGHWKRNCSKYLADLKSGLDKKKKESGYMFILNGAAVSWKFHGGEVFNIIGVHSGFRGFIKRTANKNKARPAAPRRRPSCRITGEEDGADHAYHREPSPGGGHHRSIESPWLPTESIRPRPSSRAARLPPSALHHLPWNATVETLSSPSLFDGRGAATAAVAEAEAGAKAKAEAGSSGG